MSRHAERRETVSFGQSLVDVWKARVGLKTEIPMKLVDLTLRASNSKIGFRILGAGWHSFPRALENKLTEKGWPTMENRQDHEYDFLAGLRDFYCGLIDSSLVSGPPLKFAAYFSLGGYLWRQDVYDFVTKEENIKTLESAINETISDFEKTYGDPFAIKYRQLKPLKAAFDAVKAHLPGQNTPETRLVANMKFLVANLKTYARGSVWVPPSEFQGRVEEALTEKGWDLSDPKESLIDNELKEQLWKIASMAEHRTTWFVRLGLQDKTNPPDKAERAAKDFLLVHADDIVTAAKAAAAGLDAEMATNEGLYTPRHTGRIHLEDGRVLEPKPSLSSRTACGVGGTCLSYCHEQASHPFSENMGRSSGRPRR